MPMNFYQRDATKLIRECVHEHGLPTVHFTAHLLGRNQTSDLRDSQLVFPTQGLPV